MFAVGGNNLIETMKKAKILLLCQQILCLCFVIKKLEQGIG